MPKLYTHLLYVAFILLIALVSAYQTFHSTHVPGQAHIYYSQDTKLNTKVIEQIQAADSYVYFAIYTFTRADIRDALLAAKSRGVEVKGVVDREQTQRIKEQKKIVSDLVQADIPIVFQDHLGIMHLKVVVTEKSYAFGSFNWTAAATNLNDEVLETGTDESIRTELKSTIEKMFAMYTK